MKKVVKARVGGPLEPYADGFRVTLAGMGYTTGSAEHHMYAMAHLSRWLHDEGLEPGDLDEGQVRRFLPVLWVGRRRMPTEGALAPLLGWLRDQQVVPPARAAAAAALDGLIDRYRSWLVEDRGLAAGTIRRYEVTARRFLVECGSATADDGGVKGLKGDAVTAFLLQEGSRGLTVGSVKNVVIGLRSVLRFLFVQGLTQLALAEAVPAVAGWRDGALPATLSVSDVSALLSSCDRDAPIGLRDFAILLLLARLGLRSAEVAGLELGDIDWRSGVIVIRRGKSRGPDLLPLPIDVGEAMAAYLKVARPRIICRSVFVTWLAPWRKMHPNTVSRTVVVACRRAGLAPVGAHRLRHALATEMLAQGAGLIDIGQVLRHRDLATTAIYAKVDSTSLRRLARPWPGVER